MTRLELMKCAQDCTDSIDWAALLAGSRPSSARSPRPALAALVDYLSGASSPPAPTEPPTPTPCPCIASMRGPLPAFLHSYLASIHREFEVARKSAAPSAPPVPPSP